MTQTPKLIVIGFTTISREGKMVFDPSDQVTVWLDNLEGISRGNLRAKEMLKRYDRMVEKAVDRLLAEDDQRRNWEDAETEASKAEWPREK